MLIERKVDERRLVMRLLAYWRGILPENGFPPTSLVDPHALGDIWPTCFVLQFPDESAEPVFCKAGHAIAVTIDGDFEGMRVSALSHESLAEHATFFADEVRARKVPITRGGAFSDPQGVIQLFRSILLPLGDETGRIEGLLGGASCRRISEKNEELVYHAAATNLRVKVGA